MFPASCHEKEPIQWNTYDTEETTGTTCPVFLALEIPFVFKAWALFDRGVLPVAGGWMAQPEWWLQVLEHVGGVVAQIRNEETERARAEAERP